MGSAGAEDAETSWNDESWDEAQYAQSLAPGSSTVHGFDDTDFGASHVSGDDGPSFNIDGTPMLGSFDMNGNPFGVTSSPGIHDMFSSDSFGSDSFGSSWSSGDSFGSSSSSDSFGSSW